MLEFNARFIDLYKRVDRIIHDAYNSAEGVTEYLRQMELNAMPGERFVSGWKTDYDRLKRLRWIRNQLVHEVGLDSDVCEEADHDWLETFRDRLISGDDPLALLRKAREAEWKRRTAQKREQKKSTPAPAQVIQQIHIKTPEQKNFWQKIKSFFSGN